jgi:hypothetical protein
MSDSFFGTVGSAVGAVTNAIGSTASSVLGATVDALSRNSGYYNSPMGTDPNMMISRYRSQGIPLGAESSYYYSPTQAQFSSGIEQKDWRVKISCPIIYNDSEIFSPLADTGGLVFPYLPQITMSHSAVYSTIDTAHTNYPFYAYKNSQIDDIAISGQFTVQNEFEGRYWLAMNHFLRTVSKMYFGQGDNLGNPPPICTLNGYGDFVYNNISCVVKQFTVEMSKDVDYIGVRIGGQNSGSDVSYVPTLSNVTVTLLPVYSRTKIKSFNLTNFAKGELLTAPDGRGFI